MCTHAEQDLCVGLALRYLAERTIFALRSVPSPHQSVFRVVFVIDNELCDCAVQSESCLWACLQSGKKKPITGLIDRLLRSLELRKYLLQII